MFSGFGATDIQSVTPVAGRGLLRETQWFAPGAGGVEPVLRVQVCENLVDQRRAQDPAGSVAGVHETTWGCHKAVR